MRGVFAVVALAVAPSCAATQHLEEMSEQSFQTLKADCALVAQAATMRLLIDGSLTVPQVALVAGVFGSIADGSIIPAGEGLLAAELQGAGLTEPEILLAFRAVESFMLHAGALNYAGGTLLVTPRTRDLMLSISSAVSQTIGATERELERGEELLESVEAEQGEGS